MTWQFLGPTNICGPRDRRGGRHAARQVLHDLRRHGDGRCVEDRQRRRHVGADLREGDHGVDWRPGDRADRTRTSSGSAPAKRTSSAVPMPGPASTSRPTRGKTWHHMGLAATQTIARIVIHPSNPDTLYVAASGHEWTDNEDRGVYKTTDGGKTWRKVLYVNPRTGAIDLVMDPSDPNVLYAVDVAAAPPEVERPAPRGRLHRERRAQEHRRRRDVDARSTRGCRRRRRGAASASMSPASESRHALRVRRQLRHRAPGQGRGARRLRPPARRRHQGRGGLPHRRQGQDVAQGQRLERQTWNALAGTYGWVFGQIRVDPTNENTVYIMGLGLNVSKNGGKTFQPLRGMHGDHHALWIDPDNPQFLVNGNDGGMVVSYDQGLTWRQFLDNLPAVQFFNVSYDMETPFHVYGSIQDHGSRRGVVDLSRGRDRIPAQAFENAPGGEGSRHAIDPHDPKIVYSAGFYHNMNRADVVEGRRARPVRSPKSITPRLSPADGVPARAVAHADRRSRRTTRTSSTSAGSTSSGRGTAATPGRRISADLTYNDPKQLGDIPYQTVFALSESPMRFGPALRGHRRRPAARDEGRRQDLERNHEGTRARSAGSRRRWRRPLTKAPCTSRRTASATTTSRRTCGSPPTSAPRGRASRRVSRSGPINVITEDPTNPKILYVGTDVGVYVTRGRRGHVGRAGRQPAHQLRARHRRAPARSRDCRGDPRARHVGDGRRAGRPRDSRSSAHAAHLLPSRVRVVGPVDQGGVRSPSAFGRPGFDLRCPDFNEPEFETLTVSRMIGQLEADIAALPPGPVALIGSSLGGFVAFHAAFRHAAPRGGRARPGPSTGSCCWRRRSSSGGSRSAG